SNGRSSKRSIQLLVDTDRPERRFTAVMDILPARMAALAVPSAEPLPDLAPPGVHRRLGHDLRRNCIASGRIRRAVAASTYDSTLAVDDVSSAPDSGWGAVSPDPFRSAALVHARGFGPSSCLEADKTHRAHVGPSPVFRDRFCCIQPTLAHPAAVRTGTQFSELAPGGASSILIYLPSVVVFPHAALA